MPLCWSDALPQRLMCESARWSSRWPVAIRLRRRRSMSRGRVMSRLSELLERIRPAGTPGAPAEGERAQRCERRLGEIVDIVTVLSSFESEAADLVTAAEERATESLRDAEVRARDIRADLPQQLASAQATNDMLDAHPGVAECDAIAADAATEIERLESVAAERIPRLSAEAIDLIWSAVSVPTQTERSL